MKTTGFSIARLTSFPGINSEMIGLLGGDLFAKAGLLLSFAILARLLGESAFGLVAWSQAIVAYASIAVDFGLSAFGTREVARQPETARWYWNSILRLRLGLALLVIFLIVLGGAIFLDDRTQFAVLLASSCWLLPCALGSEWLVQAAHRGAWIGLLRLTISLGLLLLTWIWSTGRESVVTAAALRFGAEWGGVVVGLIMTRKIFAAQLAVASGLAGPQTIKAAAPLMLSVLFTSVYAANFDTILLGLFHPSAQAGWYAAAQRLYLMLAVIPKLMLTLYYPRFARAHAAGGPTALQQDFTTLLKTSSMLGLPVIALTLVLAPDIITVLYGPRYQPSAVLLRLLAAAALPLLWGSGLPSLLMAARQERAALHCFGIATILNLTLNLALIPQFGGAGAACVTFLAETSVLLTGAYYARRHFNVTFPVPLELLKSLRTPLAVAAVAAATRWLGVAAGFTSPTVLLAMAVSASGLSWAIMMVFTRPQNHER